MGTIARNTLFYGDNLNILRDYISDESVDLIYLDLPQPVPFAFLTHLGLKIQGQAFLPDF